MSRAAAEGFFAIEKRRLVGPPEIAHISITRRRYAVGGLPSRTLKTSLTILKISGPDHPLGASLKPSYYNTRSLRQARSYRSAPYDSGRTLRRHPILFPNNLAVSIASKDDRAAEAL